MSETKINFEGNFSTYGFGKGFWHLRELMCKFWTSRHLLYEKNIKLFRLCGG